ncbi:phosphopantetheine-binding protein, partial [Streptomyces sp. NPDC059411]
MWSEVLEAGDVPYDVNFFDAGGDSLLLIVL